jgi:hypothetical protein
MTATKQQATGSYLAPNMAAEQRLGKPFAAPGSCVSRSYVESKFKVEILAEI